MDKQQLKGQLEELHTELQQAESDDTQKKEIINSVRNNVWEVLAQEEDQHQYSGLSERLNDAVAHLEASHPRATLLMRQIIDQLAFLGI